MRGTARGSPRHASLHRERTVATRLFPNLRARMGNVSLHPDHAADSADKVSAMAFRLPAV
jgi:hypothetical protein